MILAGLKQVASYFHLITGKRAVNRIKTKVKTTYPDIQFISHTAWIKFIENRHNQKLTAERRANAQRN
jgi:hypothetical protein